MSKWIVKELVKSKTHKAAFSYLLTEKNKQTKISHIQYSDLRMQEYLLEGNKNTEMSKLIYKAIGMWLDLKTNKKRKYKDDICVRCKQHSETGDLFIYCSGYGEGKYDKEIKDMQYNIFFYGSSSEIHILAKVVSSRLTILEKMLEEITWKTSWGCVDLPAEATECSYFFEL